MTPILDAFDALVRKLPGGASADAREAFLRDVREYIASCEARIAFERQTHAAARKEAGLRTRRKLALLRRECDEALELLDRAMVMLDGNLEAGCGVADLDEDVRGLRSRVRR